MNRALIRFLSLPLLALFFGACASDDGAVSPTVKPADPAAIGGGSVTPGAVTPAAPAAPAAGVTITPTP